MSVNERDFFHVMVQRTVLLMTLASHYELNDIAYIGR